MAPQKRFKNPPVVSASLACAVPVAERTPISTRPSIVPRLLEIPEAAIYIAGTNWFVEELIRNNEIPAIVVGKGRKIDVRDLDAWIEAEKGRQAIDPPAPIGFARINRKIRTAA